MTIVEHGFANAKIPLALTMGQFQEFFQITANHSRTNTMPRPKENPETIRKNHYGTRPLTIYFTVEETEAIDMLCGSKPARKFITDLIEEALRKFQQEQKARG